jgi:chromosome segregation ATPase
MNEELKVDIE